MKFKLRNSFWDNTINSCNYEVEIKSRTFHKLVVISIYSPGGTNQTLYRHQSMISDIFDTYPASGTQISLDLLRHRLKERFPEISVKLTEFKDYIDSTGESTTSGVICLKAHIETKNVDNNKIRAYAKTKR